jgi:hypothetical protein
MPLFSDFSLTSLRGCSIFRAYKVFRVELQTIFTFLRVTYTAKQPPLICLIDIGKLAAGL